jgi:hypothetical protein
MLPRTVQEPVAAPLSWCWHPVKFTKGITGLSLAEEGLLVKHITKFLTLSLPDRTQFMTNFAAGRGTPGSSGAQRGLVRSQLGRKSGYSRHFASLADVTGWNVAGERPASGLAGGPGAAWPADPSLAGGPQPGRLDGEQPGPHDAHPGRPPRARKVKV